MSSTIILRMIIEQQRRCGMIWRGMDRAVKRERIQSALWYILEVHQLGR